MDNNNKNQKKSLKKNIMKNFTHVQQKKVILVQIQIYG